MTNVRSDPEWVAQQVQANTDIYRRYREHNPFRVSDNAVEFDGPIPSAHKKGLTYHVVVRPGFASCTCPGFTTYNRGRDCSHITTVKKVLNGA